MVLWDSSLVGAEQKKYMLRIILKKTLTEQFLGLY